MLQWSRRKAFKNQSWWKTALWSRPKACKNQSWWKTILRATLTRSMMATAFSWSMLFLVFVRNKMKWNKKFLDAPSISIRGCVRPSVRPLVRPSVRWSVGPSVRHAFVKIAENGVMQLCSYAVMRYAVRGASYVVYTALFFLSRKKGS